jgi:hypothetical protein
LASHDVENNIDYLMITKSFDACQLTSISFFRTPSCLSHAL